MMTIHEEEGLQEASHASPRFWLYAPNVHVGGGRVLLTALLDALGGRDGLILILDQRLDVTIPPAAEVWQVPPTVAGRMRVELRLWKMLGEDDTLLSLNNLPPLLARRGRQSVFIQNRYVLDSSQDGALGFPVRLRVWSERLWLRAALSPIHRLLVQTPSMRRQVRVATGYDAEIVPFAKLPVQMEKGVVEQRVDFLYVASGEPHKNHRNLIQAWILLSEEGCFPSLCLTLDESRFPELFHWIEQMRLRYRLHLENRSELKQGELSTLYASAKALIFPSLFESFGLPLLEAQRAGLPIIASEIDVVRDVVAPVESFDPTSPISIARAVKRFLGLETPSLPLMGADHFLRLVERGDLPPPAEGG